MANKWHPCLNLKFRKCPWLWKSYQQCLYVTGLQLILHLFSLQSTVFTSLKSNNDFGKKKQFSRLVVHVCLQESSRKGLQFRVTIQTSTDSHQQNKAVFRVKWTHYLEEKLRMHAVTLALFSEVSALFGSIYRGGWPWRFSSSERHKGSPYPSNQVIIASQAFATSRNLPLSVCLYSGRRCERSRHMKWCHVTSSRQNIVTQGTVFNDYNSCIDTALQMFGLFWTYIQCS